MTSEIYLNYRKPAQERILDLIQQSGGARYSEIITCSSEFSQGLLKRVLKELVNSGQVRKVVLYIPREKYSSKNGRPERTINAS